MISKPIKRFVMLNFNIITIKDEREGNGIFAIYF